MSNKQEKMFAIIANWELSGLDRKSFCEQHGLKLSTFSYWRNRYKQSTMVSSDNFKPITPEKIQDSTIELIYPNGVKMILPPGFIFVCPAV